MEEKKDETPNGEDNVSVKDSQTVIVKETKQMTFRNVPIDMWTRFRDYSRKYCRGNWTLALGKMLDLAELTPMINMLAEKTGEIEARLEEHLNEGKEEPIRKAPKTFGKKEE